jgi:FAD/FMN-containing dehydrogenase
MSSAARTDRDQTVTRLARSLRAGLEDRRTVPPPAGEPPAPAATNAALDRLRDASRDLAPAAVAPAVPPPPRLAADEDLRLLRLHADLLHFTLAAPSRTARWLLRPLRRVLGVLLRPWWDWQTRFNGLAADEFERGANFRRDALAAFEGINAALRSLQGDWLREAARQRTMNADTAAAVEAAQAEVVRQVHALYKQLVEAVHALQVQIAEQSRLHEELVERNHLLCRQLRPEAEAA